MIEVGQTRMMRDGHYVEVIEIHRNLPVPTGSSYLVTLSLLVWSNQAIGYLRTAPFLIRRYSTVCGYPLIELDTTL